MKQQRLNSSQGGMALIVGLILLALMTVMALTSFNIGRTSMDIVSNLQRHNEVVSAANSAIQEVLSTTRLFKTPGTIFLVPCSGANTRCYDVNGDGTNDITVTLNPTPTCVTAMAIPNAALNHDKPEDAACVVEINDPNFVEGANSGNSLCAESVWEINAVAVDAITEAQITVTEGAGIRVPANNVFGVCL